MTTVQYIILLFFHLFDRKKFFLMVGVVFRYNLLVEEMQIKLLQGERRNFNCLYKIKNGHNSSNKQNRIIWLFYWCASYFFNIFFKQFYMICWVGRYLSPKLKPIKAFIIEQSLTFAICEKRTHSLNSSTVIFTNSCTVFLILLITFVTRRQIFIKIRLLVNSRYNCPST